MDSLKSMIDRCKSKKTKVVAKVVTNQGTFHGVNVESSCHTLSVCAERAAIIVGVCTVGPNFTIKEVEVYAEKKGAPIDIVPCGSCRQLIAEFSDGETVVQDRPMDYWMPNPYL